MVRYKLSVENAPNGVFFVVVELPSKKEIARMKIEKNQAADLLVRLERIRIARDIELFSESEGKTFKMILMTTSRKFTLKRIVMKSLGIIDEPVKLPVIKGTYGVNFVSKAREALSEIVEDLPFSDLG